MAKTQSSTPPFFNFLKEGFLLPSRNRRLFVAVFLFVVASSTSLHFLARNLAIQPEVVTDDDKSSLDTTSGSALNGTDDPTTRMIPEFKGDTSWNTTLMVRVAGDHLFSVIGDSLIRVIVVFAAVTTYSSGEPLHTFADLLRKAKTRHKGPLLTRAFLYALGIVAYVGVLAAVVTLLAALTFALVFFLALEQGTFQSVIYAASLVLVAAVFFLHYCFSFLCWFSVVVAVAEPPAGRHARTRAAVGRVWHLMNGKKMRALLLISVTAALQNVFTPAVHTLAAKMMMSNNTAAASMLLDAILTAVEEVFTVCAMTVFYYECTAGSTDATGFGV